MDKNTINSILELCKTFAIDVDKYEIDGDPKDLQIEIPKFHTTLWIIEDTILGCHVNGVAIRKKQIYSQIELCIRSLMASKYEQRFE